MRSDSRAGGGRTHGTWLTLAAVLACAAFRDMLRAKGYTLTYVEVSNGVHGVETWAGRLPVGLEALAAPPPR